MTRTEALRRFVLASPKACKLLARRDDAEILVSLSDNAVMTGFLQAGRLVSATEIGRLVADLVTSEGPSTPATEGDVMTVRMVAAYA